MEQGIKHKEGKNSLELDWTFIRHLGERMDANKGKYPPYNWKKPMENPYELLNAAQRHLIALHEGILEDDGRKFGHIEGAAANMMMYFAQMMLREKDNFSKELIEHFSNTRELIFNGKDLLPTTCEKIHVPYHVMDIWNNKKEDKKKEEYFKINGDQKISDFMEMFGTTIEEQDGTTRFEMSDIKIIKTPDGFLLNNATE